MIQQRLSTFHKCERMKKQPDSLYFPKYLRSKTLPQLRLIALHIAGTLREIPNGHNFPTKLSFYVYDLSLLNHLHSHKRFYPLLVVLHPIETYQKDPDCQWCDLVAQVGMVPDRIHNVL